VNLFILATYGVAVGIAAAMYNDDFNHNSASTPRSYSYREMVNRTFLSANRAPVIGAGFGLASAFYDLLNLSGDGDKPST